MQSQWQSAAVCSRNPFVVLTAGDGGAMVEQVGDDDRHVVTRECKQNHVLWSGRWAFGGF
jgi:hypothetical protein